MSIFIDFSLLKRNPKFALLLLGRFISFSGAMITNVALPYQIYHLTYSTLIVGLLGLIQLIPLLLTALYGGVLADQYNRRIMIITAELFLLIASLILWYNASLAQPHLWIVFLIGGFTSAIMGLHRPAFAGLEQQLVIPQDYAQMGAIKAIMMNTCLILGPALGGWIIAHFNLQIAYLTDAATFVVSLAAIFFIGQIAKPSLTKPHKNLVALKQGLYYAISRQDLLGSYLVDFFAMVFAMPQALFPAIAFHHGGAYTLGFLYSAPAVGAVIVSIFSGWIHGIQRYCFGIAISASFWGGAIILFGLALFINLWLALFFLAIAGAADGISGIFRNTLWNETIPQSMRGRLAGIEMISYMSGPKLGNTEAGFVAAAFGITTSIVSGGVLCIIAIAGCCYFLPQFWNYRSTINK